MQPNPFQVVGRNIHVGELARDLFGDRRADLFEHLSAFLDEQLVGLTNAALVGAIEEAKVISDVIGEQRLQARIQNIPASSAVRCGITLDHDCRGDVPKNKVGVAIAEVEMTRTDLRIDDQYTRGAPGFHGVAGLLNAERGRGAGNIHIKGEPAGAEG